METIITGVCLVMPIVVLWFNVRELQRHVNSLDATNQEHGDRFTALSKALDDVRINADYAIKTLNDNARKFGIPYFKNR